MGHMRSTLGRVAVCLVMSFVVTAVPLVLFASPAVAPWSCPPDYIYQSANVNGLQIGPSILYAQVQMWAHYYHPTRFTCGILFKYMVIQTIGPGQWTLNSLGGDVDVRLSISQPSWSTTYSLGTWTVQPPYVYVTVVSGGAGYSYVTWDGQLYFPAPSGYATLSGFDTNPWYAASFGQSYPVTFTLHNNVVGGETNSQTLYMTS